MLLDNNSMVKMTHLKGNLGLKSSSLAPTSCKLSTQYLVLDHMTNHYDKISKAKSAIDNKPPKSMMTSQKMRDRRTRERVTSPTHNRPMSSMSITQGMTNQDNFQDYQDFLDEEPEDEEGRLVQSIMKTTLVDKSRSNGSNDATYNSRSHNYSSNTTTDMSARHTDDYTGYEDQRRMKNQNQRPQSARSVCSVTRGNNNRVPINTHDPKRITYDGDVLDKRSYCFTEPDRPFTPRTLKSNHKSRLKSSKCYNAPPKNQTGKRDASEASFVQEKEKAKANEQQNNFPAGANRPKPRARTRQHIRSGGNSNSYNPLEETVATNKLSETALMDMSLQSRDDRYNNNNQGDEERRDVPPLSISIDTDHFKWLQEQASKAQVRARHSSNMKGGRGRPVRGEESYAQNEEEEEGSRRHGNDLGRSIHFETLKKEEEQKYLAFVKEVTDDVITKGISTDKVLNKVFEGHIERRKVDLDEDRMRSMIKNLKKDLGLRDTSVERKGHRVDFQDQRKKLSSSRSQSSQRSTEQPINGSNGSLVHSDSRNSLNENGLTATNMTMESTSTMKFDQTGDVFSTIRSEQQNNMDDLSDGELAPDNDNNNIDNGHDNDNLSGKASDTNIYDDDNDELTATQVIKEYQMNLTAKDEANGDYNRMFSSESANSGTSNSNAQKSSSDLNLNDRPATGERRAEDGNLNETLTDVTGSNGNSGNTSNTVNGINSSSTMESQRSPALSTSTTSSNGGQQLPKSRLRNKRRNRENAKEHQVSTSGSNMESSSVIEETEEPSWGDSNSMRGDNDNASSTNNDTESDMKQTPVPTPTKRVNGNSIDKQQEGVRSEENGSVNEYEDDYEDDDF